MILSPLLENLIRSGTRNDDESGREAWIRHHRLEPLVYGVEMDSLAFRPDFVSECRQAYMNMTGRSVRFRTEALRLVNVLSQSGILSVAWRGVFHGDELYGDPGLRYCTDVDLIVTPAHRGAALDCLLRDGYLLRNRLIPRWYLHRHHLHWPLISPSGDIPVDLHWAIDHPYKNMSMPVDLALMTRLDGKLQVALYHAEKECRIFHIGTASMAVVHLLRHGPLLPWLDLVVMMGRATPAERAQAEQQMIDRGHGALWSRSLEVIHTLSHGSIPASSSVVPPDVAAPSSLAAQFAFRLGCRPEALTDWMDFLCARSNAPRWHQRVLDHSARWLKIIRLFADTLLCGVWMAVRKLSKSRGANE